MPLSQEQILQLRSQYGFDKPSSSASASPHQGMSAEQRIQDLWGPTPNQGLAQRNATLGPNTDKFKAGGVIGAFQDVAKGAAKRGANTLLDLGHIGQKIQGVVGSGIDAVTGDKYDFSGDAQKGVFNPQTESGANLRQELKPQNLGEKIGGGIEAVAELAVPIGGAPAKTILGKTAQGALIGGGMGTAQGVAHDESLGGVAKDAAIGAAAGGALGLAGGVVGKIIEKKNPDAFVRDLVTPPINKNKTGEFATRIRTGKVLEGKGLLGERTVLPTPRQLDVEAEIKTIPGLTRAKSKLEANNLIHDEVGRVATQLEDRLDSMEVQPVVTQDLWDNFVQGVDDDIKKNPFLTGDAEEMSRRIFKKFNELLPKDRDITGKDILEARKGLDAWMKAQRGTGIFDPAKESAASQALRAVRQGANELLEKVADDVPTQEMLRKQTLMYDAIDTISEKALKEASRVSTRFFENHPLLGKALKVVGIAAAGGAAGVVGVNAVNAKGGSD